MKRSLMVLAGLALATCLAGCSTGVPPQVLTERERAALDHRARQAMVHGQQRVGQSRFDEALGDFLEAKQNLEILADDQPTIDRLAQATFWAGFCYERTDRPGQALVYYRETIDRFPTSDACRQARIRLNGLE